MCNVLLFNLLVSPGAAEPLSGDPGVSRPGQAVVTIHLLHKYPLQSDPAIPKAGGVVLKFLQPRTPNPAHIGRTQTITSVGFKSVCNFSTVLGRESSRRGVMDQNGGLLPTHLPRIQLMMLLGKGDFPCDNPAEEPFARLTSLYSR